MEYPPYREPPSILSTAPTEILCYVISLNSRCNAFQARVVELEGLLREAAPAVPEVLEARILEALDPSEVKS